MPKSDNSELRENALDSSALAYFRQQRKLSGQVGRRKTSDTSRAFDSQPSLIMSYSEYSDRISREQVALTRPLTNRGPLPGQYYDWLFTLVAGQNILLYGPGDHSEQLTDFAKDYLAGEDCIEFSGAPRLDEGECGSSQSLYYVNETRAGESAWPKVLRRLLEVVVRDVLHLVPGKSDMMLPDDASLLFVAFAHLAKRLDIHYGRRDEAQVASHSNLSGGRSTRGHASHPGSEQRLRGRYAHNQTRLFLIIHDLDGAVLSSPDAQQCLAALASSASVSILASISCLNAPLLWTPLSLAAFHWRFVLAPTYATGVLPSQLACFGRAPTGSSRDGGILHGLTAGGVADEAVADTEVLVTVLQSVDAVTKELLRLMCRQICDRQRGQVSVEEKQLRANEIIVSKFLQQAANKLLVKSRDEMLQKLRELLDTRLVVLAQQTSSSAAKSGSGKKTETLRVLLANEDLHWIAGESLDAKPPTASSLPTVPVSGESRPGRKRGPEPTISGDDDADADVGDEDDGDADSQRGDPPRAHIVASSDDDSDAGVLAGRRRSQRKGPGSKSKRVGSKKRRAS